MKWLLLILPPRSLRLPTWQLHQTLLNLLFQLAFKANSKAPAVTVQLLASQLLSSFQLLAETLLVTLFKRVTLFKVLLPSTAVQPILFDGPTTSPATQLPLVLLSIFCQLTVLCTQYETAIR